MQPTAEQDDPAITDVSTQRNTSPPFRLRQVPLAEAALREASGCDIVRAVPETWEHLHLRLRKKRDGKCTSRS